MMYRSRYMYYIICGMRSKIFCDTLAIGYYDTDTYYVTTVYVGIWALRGGRVVRRGPWEIFEL